jgi:hypothetical protein
MQLLFTLLGANSGITEPRFKNAYLSYCCFSKETLVSGNALNRTISHAPIAMGV